jgi:hypothetical protein
MWRREGSEELVGNDLNTSLYNQSLSNHIFHSNAKNYSHGSYLTKISLFYFPLYTIHVKFSIINLILVIPSLLVNVEFIG